MQKGLRLKNVDLGFAKKNLRKDARCIWRMKGQKCELVIALNVAIFY